MPFKGFEGPAGTGKTHELIETVRLRVGGDGIHPQQRILALTFMHGSRRRLDERLMGTVETRARPECISTALWLSLQSLPPDRIPAERIHVRRVPPIHQQAFGYRGFGAAARLAGEGRSSDLQNDQHQPKFAVDQDLPNTFRIPEARVRIDRLSSCASSMATTGKDLVTQRAISGRSSNIPQASQTSSNSFMLGSTGRALCHLRMT